MKVPVVKRHTAESLSLEKEFGLTINANVQRKNTEKWKKIEKKWNEKKNQSKKWVKVKIKKNKEGGPE